MKLIETKAIETRAVRFRSYGEPVDVLRMENALLDAPYGNRIRVSVTACGLNPADWALCRGLFPKDLPRGIGLEASGKVEALGEGVQGIAVGDAVFGPVDFINFSSAGAADFAILQHWTRIPDGLSPIEAAALPMAVGTANSSLDCLGATAEDVVVIHGAGTTVGFAAVQIALLRNLRVIATAGKASADRLRSLGVPVTAYGDGMVERVLTLTGQSLIYVLDTAPTSGALPALVEIAKDAKRVVTISDFEAAKDLGVRTHISNSETMRYELLSHFAKLAAEGKFTIPVARTFPLQNWREALDLSQGQKAGGKIILLPQTI